MIILHFQNKARGRLRQSEVFFQLADHGAVVHPGIYSGLYLISRTVEVFDRAIVVICAVKYKLGF